MIPRRSQHADVALRRNAGLVLRYVSIAATGAGLGVALLDQKPVLCVPPSAHAHKSPTPVKPFSFQLELERTMFVGFDGILSNTEEVTNLITGFTAGFGLEQCIFYSSVPSPEKRLDDCSDQTESRHHRMAQGFSDGGFADVDPFMRRLRQIGYAFRA